MVSLAGLLSFPFLVNWRAKAIPRSVAMTEVAGTATLIAIPALAVAGFATSLPVCLSGVAIALGCLACAVALPTQLIQIYTPSAVKARVTAFALFVMFLISIGIGPVLVPFIACLLYTSRCV